MLHAPLLALSLTCSLAFSFGNPGGVYAGSSADTTAAALSAAVFMAPARGSVDVDTSAVGEEGPALKKRIDGRAGDILLANEVLPAKEAGDARFVVTIRPAGEDEPGWLATVTVERDGGPVDDATRAIDCKLCTEGELVDRVGAALEELIPAHATAPEPADTTEPGGPTDTPDETPPTEPTGPKDKKLGTLGYAGIGVAALGVVGIGIGAGLLAKQPVLLEDDPSKQKTYKAPGAATLAVGGVALVTGVALIVVDQLKRKRGSSTAALPYVGPDGGGIAFVTRF
jgi:hypothetical protein